MPTHTIQELVYSHLGNKTRSGNIVIKPVFQEVGKAYADEIGGIFSLRMTRVPMHFGNPYSSDKTAVSNGCIQTQSVKESVLEYIAWVLGHRPDVEPERQAWIFNQLCDGSLKQKPIVYYKELKEPSHATALDFMINKFNMTRYIEVLRNGK